jgi:hypothetical protein
MGRKRRVGQMVAFHFVAGDVNAAGSMRQDKERLACRQTGAELFWTNHPRLIS